MQDFLYCKKMKHLNDFKTLRGLFEFKLLCKITNFFDDTITNRSRVSFKDKPIIFKAISILK